MLRIFRSEHPDLITSRFLGLVIAAAYAVRILLMPFTAQNDLVLTAWKSHFVNQGYWNIYARAAEVQEERQIVTEHPPAAYPYGFYLFNAAWLESLRTTNLISLDAWHSAWSITNRALWFLLLKLPLLTADLAIGFILLKSAQPGRGLFSWAVWACSLSGAYVLMMGQNDLYPALFATLAAALATRAMNQREDRRAGAM
ncbi:MAG: hypothetical protein ACK4WM_11495 [Thermoflexales bacterium]